MKNYQQLFTELINHLRSMVEIEVTVALLMPPVTENELDEIEQDFEIALNEDIRTFYKQVGGVSISWEFKDSMSLPNNEKYIVHGNINILPVHDVFWGKNDLGWHDILWFENMDVKFRKKLMSLRPFEMFDKEDTGCVCFCIEKKRVRKGLFLYSVDNSLLDINIDLNIYLDLLIASSGIFRWQYLLTKDSYNLSNEIFKNSMSKYLPKVIYKMKFDEFIKKMQNIKIRK